MSSDPVKIEVMAVTQSSPPAISLVFAVNSLIYKTESFPLNLE